MRVVLWTAVALATVAGCGERKADGAPDAATVAGDAVGGILKDAATQDVRDAANPYDGMDDPCVLLGAQDVEPVLGPLRAAPWRSGSTCHFAGADGQRIDVDVYFSGAQIQANLMNAVNREISKGLIVNTARGLDTLEGRWDEAHWRLGDYLETRRGDVGVTVQMGNTARPDPVAAATLADAAYARLDQPLPYDGDAAQEPAPLVAPGDACALLTRDDVTAALGAPAGDPQPGGEGRSTYCVWPVNTPNGRREFSLNVTWSDGFTEFNTKAGGAGLAQTNVVEPELAKATEGRDADAVMKEMLRDPAGAKALGPMRDMLRKGGTELRDSSLILKHDGDVKGPWTRAALLHGSEFLAVSKDVCLRMSLGGLGYERAKQLAAKALGRL
jgi:hypothetical protein